MVVVRRLTRVEPSSMLWEVCDPLKVARQAPRSIGIEVGSCRRKAMSSLMTMESGLQDVKKSHDSKA